MAEMSPAETVSFLFNALLSFFNPTLGLIVVVVMFIVGMIRGGSWMFATSTGLGFVLGYALRYMLTVVLGIAIVSM